MKIEVIFALAFRGFSSAGSEHLPYKQRVGGSNPSTPTMKTNTCQVNAEQVFFFAHYLGTKELYCSSLYLIYLKKKSPEFSEDFAAYPDVYDFTHSAALIFIYYVSR
jgi:hypothetical protein